ncbi:MAG: ankyrin repeat domain-containing protein [Acidobacteriota bacterium]
MHEAANEGRDEIVKLLIERGANVDALDGHQNTPLHLVAERYGEKPERKRMDLLVAAGAKLDARNMFGQTPLGAAVANHNDAGADYLRQKYHAHE